MKKLPIAILAIALFAVNLYAEEGVTNEAKTLMAVRTKNNKAISTETILAKIKTKVGDKFNQEVLNDDLKRLYATDYFSDISIDVEDYKEGTAVTFIVEEKPVVEDIVFKGNKAFRPQKLKTTMSTKPNEMLNLAVLAQDMNAIKDLYVKKGYPLVDVKYEMNLDKETNKAVITVTVDEKTRVKVSNITITGNKAIPEGRIKKILGTKPAWLFNAGVFKDDVFQDDLDKIKALYDDIGYLDCEVAPKMEYSDDRTQLHITIDVKEGKQYFVGSVAVKGSFIFAEKEVRSRIKMKSGSPFSTRMLRDDLMDVRQLYYKYGYMNVVVDIDRSLNSETGKIDITYAIDAKEPVYVGKIEVRGNTKTKDVVVRRELRIYPGDRFNGDKIKRSKERLYNLGLFEDVGFDTEPTDKPDMQNLVVTVKETKTGEFSFGGGYSSIDQLIGFVQVTQKNFDILNFPTFMGAGQNLSVKAELGMLRTNYDLSWADPWIFGFPYMFGFDLYRTAHQRATDVGWPYDEARWGGDMRLGKEFTDTFRGDAVYRLEDVKISNIVDNASQDITSEIGSNWISSLTLQLTQDTRDNIYSPTKGYILSGSVEDAGGIFFGDKDFIKTTGTASIYHIFFEKIVLEVKGRMGLEWPYGDSDEVPIYERFFAGGANTIRGYKERHVGPRDSGSNEPIGGEAIVVGNIEATFPIYEKMLKGAVFYDVGNAWRRAGDFIVGGDYKQGTGVGVRIKTPIGPVRLDYGFPLVRQEGDSKTGEFYFSMSHGF